MLNECRPISFDLTIHKDIKPDPVPVEPRAFIEVANDDNGVMDRAGDPSKLPTPVRRRGVSAQSNRAALTQTPAVRL
jgi:hypothetical protein